MWPKRATHRGLFSLFLFLIVVLVGTGVIFGIRGICVQTRKDLQASLQTVLSTTQNALNIWASETEKRVFLWANAEPTRLYATSLLNLSRRVKANSGNAAFLQSQVHRQLSAELTPSVKANGYLGYFVTDQNGRILSASNASLVGMNSRSLVMPSSSIEDSRGVLNLMSLGLREPVIISPFRQNGEVIPNHPILAVALAPILAPNPSKEKNQVIAYLGFLLDPEDGLNRTTQLGRLGASGETYAFNQNGYLVTKSRFENTLTKAGLISPGQSQILRVQVRDPEVNLVAGERPRLPRAQQPLTKMAQSALQHQTGFDLDGYRDYRGVQVVGAWTWDPVLNIALVTEIDVNEAYRSFYITETLVIAMLFLTVIAGIVVESGLWLQSRVLVRTVDSLETTRQKLQESIQARNEFVSIAAHELRTPLTSLRLQFNLIRKLAIEGSICQYPKDKLIRITSVSSAEIERFSKIIRNLLEVSQVAQGELRLELQEFDWMKIVQDIGFQHAQQLEQNGCKLTVKGPLSLVVRWDRSQMEQVLTNLLSNAIKFGKGQPIEIDVFEGNGDVEVSVSDHGRGIRKEDLGKVFDKFERAGAINPEGGLGLGLYLVRNIIHRHQGTVHARSTFGEGTTFTFKLPRILSEIDAQKMRAA